MIWGTYHCLQFEFATVCRSRRRGDFDFEPGPTFRGRTRLFRIPPLLDILLHFFSLSSGALGAVRHARLVTSLLFPHRAPRFSFHAAAHISTHVPTHHHHHRNSLIRHRRIKSPRWSSSSCPPPPPGVAVAPLPSPSTYRPARRLLFPTPPPPQNSNTSPTAPRATNGARSTRTTWITSEHPPPGNAPTPGVCAMSRPISPTAELAPSSPTPRTAPWPLSSRPASRPSCSPPSNRATTLPLTPQPPRPAVPVRPTGLAIRASALTPPYVSPVSRERDLHVRQTSTSNVPRHRYVDTLI